jgi:hypothetical protein
VAEELFRCDVASQPKRIITSAMMAYLRHGEAGFAGSFGAGAAFGAA